MWDRQRIWEYGSCGLWLVAMQGLPIHRDTFSRSEIAYSAESVRQECVNAEHGYRGGLVRIAAGVFQVGISGPVEPSLGKWKEGTMLNATASEKRAETLSVEPLGSSGLAKKNQDEDSEVEEAEL